MAFMNWLTSQLQVKILVAMGVLSGVAITSMVSAIQVFYSKGAEADVVVTALFGLSTFSLGALAGITKDLMNPGGDSEVFKLFSKYLDKVN